MWGTLAIDNPSSSSYKHALEAFGANMTQGQTHIFCLGKEGSTKNTAVLGYKWDSAGSNDNLFTIEHWGTGALVTVDGVGNTSFAGDVTITSANNPSLYITSSEANTDNFRMYVGGTGLSFFNTTDTRGVYFKHNNDWQFGDANGTVNTEWYGVGNAKIVATAGSASNPTYSFNSDTSTGMYRPANVELSFATDGTERMTLDSHGNMIIKENTGDPDSSKMMFKSTKQYVDDEYENFTLIGTSSLIIISDTTSNDGGVFFGSYNSSNMVLIADPQNEFRNSDNNNYINCFKNGSTSTFQVKNRRGLTKNLSVAIIGCGA